MAEQPSEARIRDLKRRLELDPASRLFVSLAEEYRKAGRTADALITLQQGLKNHPGYISAQVALGRAYLEAGNISEAIANFNKVLTADPGNLVAAKSLADIFLSRGESVEAIKKYKLYRALSGDRTVDDIVERLEREIAPPAPRASRVGGAAPLPAPPTFFDAPTEAPLSRPSRISEVPETRPGALHRGADVLEVTSIRWEESTGRGRKKEMVREAPETPLAFAADMPTQPLKLPSASPSPPTVPAAAPAVMPFAAFPEAPSEAPVFLAPATAAAETEAPFVAPSEAAGPFAAGPEGPEPTLETGEVFGENVTFPLADVAAAPAALVENPSRRPTDRLDSSQATARQQPQEPALALARAAEEPPAEPQGRALGDLYFAQGHYAEALRIYDELVAVHPFDAELKRLRRDAEARLLPAGAQPGAAASEPALQRRLARIRTLKEWLSVVQAG